MQFVREGAIISGYDDTLPDTKGWMGNVIHLGRFNLGFQTFRHYYKCVDDGCAVSSTYYVNPIKPNPDIGKTHEILVANNGPSPKLATEKMNFGDRIKIYTNSGMIDERKSSGIAYGRDNKNEYLCINPHGCEIGIIIRPNSTLDCVRIS